MCSPSCLTCINDSVPGNIRYEHETDHPFVRSLGLRISGIMQPTQQRHLNILRGRMSTEEGLFTNSVWKAFKEGRNKCISIILKKKKE
jgi:hypothetical protein